MTHRESIAFPPPVVSRLNLLPAPSPGDGIPVCLLVFGDAAVQRQLHPELHTPAVPRNHAVDHRQVEGFAWQLLASTAAGGSDLSTSPGTGPFLFFLAAILGWFKKMAEHFVLFAFCSSLKCY